ncbi:hypothetical protein AGLY_006869 [Aphis glycines]|uniref:Uncharacterized protein n=1 Tax=Aphis glycines TaxID=307491 RepID=A0A6G0TQS2_APHGL|nr:hypothetical protein AGLY_006869 [Aphis glycines]
MYSYNFLITIRITYEELCIKFTSILIGIYDLYFLNNNKYQKSFEAKPLFNAVLKIYGEPCTKFSKLSYKRKKFYDFSTSKLLANFRVFDRFPTIKTTHKEPCIKFSKLFGHPKIFYRHFKKNFSKKSKISVIPLTLTFGENFNIEFVTVMDVLNLILIRYHCIRKTILKRRRSAYFI